MSAEAVMKFSHDPHPEGQTTEFEDPFSREIWESTYKHHSDATVNDTFWRVARYVAGAEETEVLRQEWASKFYDMLTGFKCTPGGRILANAGAGWNGTTMANCFVSPRGSYDIDSIPGIMTDIENQAQTLKSEGGWGQNFSWLRPRGAFIHGVGVETPGAVKYMEIYDKVSDVITAGSGRKIAQSKAKPKIRKGAMMGILDCWHPDIVEFITAKQQPGRLTKFNMSVNCTDEFMAKVIRAREIEGKMDRLSKRILRTQGDATGLRKEHAALNEQFEEADRWSLRFPETTYASYKEEWDGDIKGWEAKGYPTIEYRQVSVLWLWNLITESTYNRNEPGVLFLDRANHYDPLSSYHHKIVATNPCFSADTLIGTADGRGAVPIQQLAEEGKDIPVYSLDKWTGKVTIKMARHPRITGHDMDLLRVTLDDGSHLDVTPNHKFSLIDGREVQADDLVPGDSLPRFTRRQEHQTGKGRGPSRKRYWQVTTDINNRHSRAFEHRMIAKFHDARTWEQIYDENKAHGWIKGGLVVHHRDYDSLNNRPENLKIMTWGDHQQFHAEHDCSGAKNGMYGRKHGSGTLEKISASSKERWQDPAFRDLQKRKQAEAITEETRQAISESRKRINIEYWKQCERETDLETVWIDEQLFVKKTCEATGVDFVVPWHRREVSFAPGVNAMESYTYKERAAERMRATKRENAKRNRHLQIMAYKDLQGELGRDPLRTEWVARCKSQGVKHRLNPKADNPFIFGTYKALQDFASDYNHRVKSVERLPGKHTVYNLTVDINHTVSVVTSQSSDNSLFSGVYVLNCGEQALPPGGVCDLGSINLTQFVTQERQGFDLDRVRQYTRYLVRFLDNVNTLSHAPLQEYVDSMRDKRRVGIGILGWGSALLLMKIRFGSERARELRDLVMQVVATEAYMTSIDLAEEKGMFRYCDPERHAEAPFVRELGLSTEYMEKLRRCGIRNSSLLSIQPTGNTSCFANVVSGGLEPLFLPEYTRTVILGTIPDEIAEVCPRWFEDAWSETDLFKFVKEGDDEILRGEFNGTVYKIDRNRGLTKEVPCADYAVRRLKEEGEWDPAADWAVTTTGLSVSDHVNDMKGFARWVDSSISKTVNLPNKYPYDDFQDLYLDAYTSGKIRGLTTYRAGTMMTVLSAKEEREGYEEEVIKDDVKLPTQMPSTTTTMRADGKKWWITTLMDEAGRRPVAFFVSTNHSEKDATTHDAVDRLMDLAKRKRIPKRWRDKTEEKMRRDNNVQKVCRAAALNLRHGVLIKNVVSALESVEDVYVGSFLFQFRKHLAGFIRDGEKVENEKCLECGGEIVYSEGCKRCTSCGSSKCG